MTENKDVAYFEGVTDTALAGCGSFGLSWEREYISSGRAKERRKVAVSSPASRHAATFTHQPSTNLASPFAQY